MQDLSRDEYSYKAERDHLADDAPCICQGCATAWRYDQLRPIGDCSLTPGDASPAGRCGDPSCDTLAYSAPKVETPAALSALIAAERFISGFEGDELQDGIGDLLATIRAAIDGRPCPMQTAINALYLACGHEGSEESEALADLPCALNAAIGDVIELADAATRAADAEAASESDDEADTAYALRERLEPLGYFIEHGAFDWNVYTPGGSIIIPRGQAMQDSELDAWRLADAHHRNAECTCWTDKWDADDHAESCPLAGLPRLAQSAD